MKLLLLSAVLLYGAIALLAYVAADRMIFQPSPASYDARRLGATMIPGGEDGVSIATLYLPNPRAALTLLYAHGNAEDLGMVAPYLEALRRDGFAVLAFDYRGYGASTGGQTTASGATRDIEAVYRHAVHTLGVPASRLVLYGRSVGSGPATDLAARLPIGGLVLESAFTSTFRVVTHAPILPFDRFPNLHHLRRVRVPVLVIHGTDDEVVPVAHGRRLFAVAGEPKRAFWVEGAHHNDVTLVGGARYFAVLREFGALVESRAAPTP